jgi:DNA-binding PadR family transcriptional regulator
MSVDRPPAVVRSTGRTIAELARLASPAAMILTSLAGGPKHGYAIMEDIEEMSGIRFGPGTLYGALSRLEELGLIEALSSEDRRIPYRLTPIGRLAIRLNLTATRRFVEAGLRRLGEI